MAKAKWPTFTPSGGLGKTALEALAAKVVKITTDDEDPSYLFTSPPHGLTSHYLQNVYAEIAEKLAEDVDKTMLNGLVGNHHAHTPLKFHMGVGESVKIQFMPPPNYAAKAEDSLIQQVTVKQWQYLFSVSASAVKASQEEEEGVGSSISTVLGNVYSGVCLFDEVLVLLKGHPETTEILCDESDYRDMAAAAIKFYSEKPVQALMDSVGLHWEYEQDWKKQEYTVSVRLRVNNRPVRIISQD